MAEPSEDTTMPRRTVLQGVGAGAVALTAHTVSTSPTVSAENNQPNMLVLIYDDSPREDYTKAFPVHDEYDVPGCVAVCPGLMGTDSRWMHPGHLEELHDAGWEVMSHTLEHRPLGEIPVRGDIEEGDTEIHVQSNLHGNHPGDEIVILDNGSETTATVVGRDSEGDNDFLILDDPIDESFAAGDGFTTWVRYSEEFTREILEGSKAQIEDWGFGPVNAYVHTYNRYDGLVSELVEEYYEAVPNRRRNGHNPTFEPNPFDLGRENFENDKLEDEYIEEFLDVIANEPEFGILYGHTNLNSFTAERIEFVIREAQERDIEIVTLTTALTELDVLDNGNGVTDPNDDDNGQGADDDTVITDDNGGTFDGLVNQLREAIDGLFARIRSLFS